MKTKLGGKKPETVAMEVHKQLLEAIAEVTANSADAAKLSTGDSIKLRVLIELIVQKMIAEAVGNAELNKLPREAVMACLIESIALWNLRIDKQCFRATSAVWN